MRRETERKNEKDIYGGSNAAFAFALCGCNTVTSPEATYSPYGYGQKYGDLQRGEVTPARIINGTGMPQGCVPIFRMTKAYFGTVPTA